jgi:asparagine synthase (glutamine-hydrolysing)
MLIGATGKLAHDHAALVAPWHPGASDTVHWIGTGEIVVAVRPWKIATMDAEQRWASDPATGSWLALSGHLFRDAAITDNGRPDSIASRLLERLTWRGLEGIAEFDGTFAVAWFDGLSHRLTLIRDRFGVEPFFYGQARDSVLFGSRGRDLIGTGMLPGGLCPQGLAEYLAYCYVPSDATLDRHVRQVPAGSYIIIDSTGEVLKPQRWYQLSYAEPYVSDEMAIAQQFRTLLEQAIVRRMDTPRLGVFLSGGMDSSSVVTFMRRHQPGLIHTFAFRCPGHSFDESFYARTLAEILQTKHAEVEYGEQQALISEAVVEEMDIPFCNVGINIGSWLLGSVAAGCVDYVLTGDGGEELWGSHPVYAAQRLFRRYERLHLPRVLHRSLLSLADWIPDSDQKSDLRVKLKRVLPTAQLPRTLGHFRWQTYYGPSALGNLLVPEVAAQICEQDPFKCVLEAFNNYNGPDDGLSPLLYNDYTTASSYYFKRLQLIRHFGVEARCPFYDQALVEFGARMPARLKLERFGRTKRLFRVAMEGILPDIINRRQDKLGLSIPLKNWLRQPGPLAARVAEVCSPAAIRARGLFRPEAVARLFAEHRARRHNHSHRLWALYVLELWLRARDRGREQD